jgi:hypothetical protein
MPWKVKAAAWSQVNLAVTTSNSGSELNVDAQPSPVTMGSTVSVGAVDAHVSFVDDPAQADRVGGGSAVNCGGEEFCVSDFSD